jgi:hypothetical protein
MVGWYIYLHTVIDKNNAVDVSAMEFLEAEYQALDRLLADTKTDHGWNLEYHVGGVNVETDAGDVYFDVRDSVKHMCSLQYTLKGDPEDKGACVLQEHDALLALLRQCQSAVSAIHETFSGTKQGAKRVWEQIDLNPTRGILARCIQPVATILFSPLVGVGWVMGTLHLRREYRVLHAYEYSRRALLAGRRCYERLGQQPGWQAEAKTILGKLDELDYAYEDIIGRSRKSLELRQELLRATFYGLKPLPKREFPLNAYEYVPSHTDAA